MKTTEQLPLSEELAPREESLALSPTNPIGRMIEAITQSGVSAENMAVLERMMALYEQVETKNAEKAFAQAFVALQSDLPAIQASKAVPNRDGTIRYHFAPYESIMEQVKPYLQKHGFTISFSTDYSQTAPIRLVKTCTLQHVGGHAKTNSFAARVGDGPPGSSPAQGDGAASTYAKRFVLCDALNIVIAGMDDDARAEGGPITLEEARDFQMRVENLNANRDKFLAVAGATSYATIPASKWATLDEMLRKKESAAVPH